MTASPSPDRTYSIAVVPGDGIGPEVCDAAVKVLKHALPAGIDMRFRAYPGGAECYLDCGEALPPATLDACVKADAILHGAAGLPDVLHADGTEAGQDFSMKIRAALDLYANIRPIRHVPGAPIRLAGRSPGDIDFTIVRENTEGLYAARGGGTVLRGAVAADTLLMTREGVERIARKAADIARSRNGAPLDGVRRVTIVDKANVLRSFAYFRRVVEETLAGYPDIEIDHVIVDAMTVHMIERPERFDVVVCENLLGDILSDLGAALIGGMGLAPSGEVGDRHGYFQGSHGSAPDIAGRGIANPIACILSAAMMLDWLADRHSDNALYETGDRIRDAVTRVLREGAALTRDIGGSASTSDCAEAVCAALETMRAA